MDRQWLRNLAQSEYSSHGWQLADPSSPSDLAHTHVQDILAKLYQKTKDAIDIFNVHADERKQLRLFHLTLKAGAKPCGFAIMIKNLQIKLEQHGAILKSDALLMRGYQTIQTPLREFSPHFDTFGEVAWIMDHKIPMDAERITRVMLEDTLRLGYQSGVIPYVPLIPKPID